MARFAADVHVSKYVLIIFKTAFSQVSTAADLTNLPWRIPSLLAPRVGRCAQLRVALLAPFNVFPMRLPSYSPCPRSVTTVCDRV